MASRRMIDEAFWESETVAGWDYFQRLLFIGMFCKADDQGRMKANAAWIRAQVFPYDDVELDRLQGALDLFVASESVQVYEVDGTKYLQFLNWWTWQKHTWAWPSKYPAPPEWLDRVCYRKGNTVIKSGWDESDTKEESESQTSDPTMTPSRTRGETSLGSAPSTSGSISTRGSTSGSESTRANNNAHGAKAAADACLRAVHDLGIQEPKATNLVERAGAEGFIDVLVPELEAWLAEYRLQDDIKNPVGLAIRQVEDRVAPPNRAGPEGTVLARKRLEELPY